MSDKDILSPIIVAQLFEFDNASYQDGNLFSLIEDSCLSEWAADARFLTEEHKQQSLHDRVPIRVNLEQQFVPIEDNGEVLTLPAPERCTLLDDADLSDAAYLEGLVNYLESEEMDASGTQSSPSQDEDFPQILSLVEISRLKTDDLRCSLCKIKYGKVKADTTDSASGVDPGFPRKEVPEYPTKLPCGHIFGTQCIKTQLLERTASCSLCGFQFHPVQ